MSMLDEARVEALAERARRVGARASNEPRDLDTLLRVVEELSTVLVEAIGELQTLARRAPDGGGV